MTIVSGIARKIGSEHERHTGVLGRLTLRGLLLLAVTELTVLALAGMNVVVSGNPG